MIDAETVENELKNLKLTTRPALDRRILHDAESVLEATASCRDSAGPGVWRKIMTSHWTKLTTVAAAIAIAVISLTLFNRSTPVVYAIEQTLEANRWLRNVHVKIEPHGNGLSEAWAQFDEQGKPLQLRLEFPVTEDGPKTTVWRGDKAEVWFKTKKLHLIVGEPIAVSKLREVFDLFDPRLGFESAYAAQVRGEAKVEVHSPSDSSQPVVLTVTAVAPSTWKEVYAIDAATKRVLKFEKYRLVEGGYQFVSRFVYDYDQKNHPDTFILRPPADVVRIDQTAQEVGVAREGLSDEELAVKVAREFFEALIAQDFVKGGRILEGIPADKLRDSMGGAKFVRIVSIGSPSPHPDPQTKFLCVPCEVEILVDGKTQVKTFTANIRQAHNQPDRFVIGGGV
jgi:hypothetical protein